MTFDEIVESVPFNEFKAEIVNLYEKYNNESIQLKNQQEINQLLTDLLGIGLTTLQDNHFNVRGAEGNRVFKDMDKAIAEWTQNGKRPLKVSHPDKGNIGENIAYNSSAFDHILTQENMGTDENPNLKKLIFSQ